MGLGFVVPKNGNSMTTSTSRGGSSRKKSFNWESTKRSKLSKNGIYIYLRLFTKYGAKRPSKKKSYGGLKSKVDEIGFLLVYSIHVNFVGMKR